MSTSSCESQQWQCYQKHSLRKIPADSNSNWAEIFLAVWYFLCWYTNIYASYQQKCWPFQMLLNSGCESILHIFIYPSIITAFYSRLQCQMVLIGAVRSCQCDLFRQKSRVSQWVKCSILNMVRPHGVELRERERTSQQLGKWLMAFSLWDAFSPCLCGR